MGVLGEMFPSRKLRSEAGEAGSGQGWRLGPIDLDAGVVEVTTGTEPDEDDDPTPDGPPPPLPSTSAPSSTGVPTSVSGPPQGYSRPHRRPPGDSAGTAPAPWRDNGAMSAPTDRRPRVLSGIQPTADSFHLGNYLGAVRQWVALQDDHDAFYFVPDLHAITVEHDPKTLAARTRNAAAQLLALGLDPDRCTVFVQSHVPEHAQLEWVLGCITGFGEASRMTQFKDKTAKQGTERATVGLFTYPILMAADVLLYQADRVPVGEDQRQHLELTRDLAQRFNTPLRAHVRRARAVHPGGRREDPGPAGPHGEDEQVGVERRGGIVELLDDPKVSAKKIRSAVTDTEREIRYDPVAKPGISNLLVIYSALSGRKIAEIEGEYAGRGYGDLKKDLAEVVAEFVSPLRERVRAYLDDPAELDRVLARGAERARGVAASTLADVHEKIGFLPPAGLLGAPRDRCIGPGRGRPGCVGPSGVGAGRRGGARGRAQGRRRQADQARAAAGPLRVAGPPRPGRAPATPTTTATTTRRRSRSSRSSRWCRC